MTIWYETEPIDYMNDFVEKWFSKSLEREWYGINGNNYSDFKVEASNWVEDNIALLQELQEMIDELPNDEIEEYPDDDSSTSTVKKEED